MSAVADFPTGEQIVAWTAQHTRRHARGPWALLGDIYISVLALAILAALVLPHLGRLTSAGPAATGLAVADPGWLMVGVACLGLLAALGPTRRLGPLFLRPFEVAWWLGLPGERTGLFLPATRLVVGAAASTGLATATAVSLVLGVSLPDLGGWLALGAATTVLLAGELIREQVRDRATPWPSLTLAGAASACLAASFLFPLPRSGAWPGLVGAAVVLAVISFGRWRAAVAPHLARLPDAQLLAGAARSFGAHVSLLSLDTRALGRMLAPRPQPPAAPARFRGLRAARGLPRPARVICAVAAADWLQLRRQSFRLAQVAISLLLAALPHLAPQLPRFQLVGCHLVAGLVLLLALAAPARQAWFDPSADHRWPAGPFTVAVGHLVVPVVGMTAWVAVTLGPRLGAAATRQEVEVAGRAFVLAGSPLGVVALVTLAGLAWGGAVLFTGFRPMPDFSVGLVPSPFGSLPPGLAQMLLAVPLAGLVAGLPASLLLLGAPAVPLLVGIQAVCTLLALGVGLQVAADAN
ncbi:DUF6297 family protein [Buchananella hordeovulneris]|uniref:DUF6297 family protein n=1 Tax=Buchananella hordeovulneris TaxID=52770 RepID=UPI000F6029F1|nr:DUF6297 family protein [Buchananella hordeovulneris]RRD43167.1 hypothetical protein EII13_07815 [Buchananella hordeovulneris]